MTRCLLASLVSAIIVIAVSMGIWMGTPLGERITFRAADEAAVTAMVQQNMPQSGFYMLPYPPKDMTDPNFIARFTQGPLVSVFVQNEGGEPMMVKCMLMMLGINFVAAALIFSLMKLVGPPACYRKRVLFITGAALFAMVAVHFPNAIYYHFTPDFLAIEGAVFMLSWFIAALVAAKIFDPAKIACCAGK